VNRAPLSGTLIEGKYEIVSKIKEGGMGSIYKVRHRLLDEIRIVKVMLPQLGSEEEYKRRFLQEAKMATRLKHPNVATIHDFALDADGTAYIIMEFIDGVNLAELLKGSGTPEIPLALEIAHQTLLALGYLHRKNVVHRDIALDNLMLTQDEEDRALVKLIDLGISKALDKTIELTSQGVFLGKLKYSSPEQLGSLGPGETLDGRSDLYSLGVVLYELLTGRTPFSGDTPRALIAAHLFTPPIPFSETDAEGRVPEELRAIVLKALEKKRADRFSSAEEFDRGLLSFRERLAHPPVTEPARELLSRIRATRQMAIAPVTPSAQDRLDRQFLAQTTPTPAAAATVPLSPVPPAAESDRTLVDPRASLESAPTRESAGPRYGVSRSLRGGPLFLTIAAAGALALGLFLWRTSWDRKGALGPPPRSATPIPIAGPVAEAQTPEFPPTAVATPEPAAEAAVGLEPSPRASDSDRLRRLTEEAASRMALSRQRAERARAKERVPELYDYGRTKEKEGRRLLAQGDHASARAAFQTATGVFERAENWARNALEARPSPPDQVAAAREPTPRAEPVRALPTAAPPAEITTLPAPASPEPVRAAVSEEDRIRETLRRYERAQNSLDVALYASVYPALTGERRKLVETAFRNLRSQTVEFEIQRIEVSNSRAVVQGFERRLAIPLIGSEQRDARGRVIRLEKRGEAWVISSLN